MRERTILYDDYLLILIEIVFDKSINIVLVYMDDDCEIDVKRMIELND